MLITHHPPHHHHRYRIVAALVAAVAALMVATSPIAPPPAAASGIRYSHEIANQVTWEYDGGGLSGIWSSRAAWGDYPLRVQVHAPGIAEPGVISVRAVIHPSDPASVVHLEAIEVRVTVTHPDGAEELIILTDESATVDAIGLILTGTTEAGGPGRYTLTGTVAYTVEADLVPAPDPTPTPDPAPDPTPGRAAESARPVPAAPTFAG